MAKEIERKYLIDQTRWQPTAEGSFIMQGYLLRSKELTIRLRLKDNRAFLTLKGAACGISRSEFEYEIPPGDAQAMLDEYANGNMVCKKRYLTNVGKHCWEVGIFEGANRGLAVAEIELESEDEEFILPDWVTREVSGDIRYNNAYLAEHPYTGWQDQV